MERDYCTATGARQLAKQIASYWQHRGHTIKAKIKPVAIKKASGIEIVYCVRSDLINGLPPGGHVS